MENELQGEVFAFLTDIMYRSSQNINNMSMNKS